MVKKVISLLVIFVVLLLIGFFIFVLPQLEVMTSYAARNTCTAVFMSNRSIDNFTKLELQQSPLHHVTVETNNQNKTVTASVFGLKKKTAYATACGCNFKPETPCPTLSPKKSIKEDYMPFIETGDTLMANVDYKSLQSAIDSAFDSDGKAIKKTKAILAYYKGQIIAEQYMDGIDQSTPLLGWSMTKSIINALIGTLVLDGRLSVNDPTSIPEWANDDRKHITIDNLLRMNTGLEWEEEYAIVSDVTTMLFKRDNIAAYAIDKPLETEPGKVWEYSSGTSNILTYVIKQSIIDYKTYLNFPQVRLFDKLKMNSAFIEMDEHGNYIGSSYGYATARDWLKFGLLYLNDGVWDGERILPEGWVEYSQSPTPHSKGEYGCHFWLNTDKQYFPDCPVDMYSASGYNGQRVFILPAQDMVIVRLGESDKLDMNQLVSNILSSISFE